jgi:hypothetical protein
VDDRRVFDRRVGPRVAFEPIDVAWRLPEPGNEKRGLRRQKPQTGSLLGLSISGARVEAPPANDLSVGAVLYMAIDDHVGKVRIRRIERSAVKGPVRYGIEFCDVDSPLTRYVNGALSSVAGSPTGGRRASDLEGHTD